MPTRRSFVRAALLAAALALMPAPAGAADGCAADLDASGAIGFADLNLLLAAWGPCPPGGPCPEDLDGSTVIGFTDLNMLLTTWGSCLETGGFPAMWINGANCGSEPDIQVHQYNADLYILRQSLCTNFEGPFVYLIFGEDRVLMQDTGAGGIAIASTVYGIIDDWLAARGQAEIELIVTHSHGHGDHTAGDNQFNGQPNTTVVGTSSTSVANFFGITNWPAGSATYDLGGRVIDVIPIPGHQSAHVALYDRRTGLAFTGDTLYPGRCYISNFAQYQASITRLVGFLDDCPVTWVLGTHIEMSNTPGDDYAFGATFHPDEHPLELTFDHLVELRDAVNAMAADPFIDVHDDFIVYPF